MRNRSKKRSVQERVYRDRRIKFLSLHPNCIIRIAGCTLRATQIHHPKGRVGDDLIDDSDWVPSCANCHEWVERNPILAKEMGFSKSRLYE